MSEKQIREEILKIQKKYYTPTSKIANDLGVDKSLLYRWLGAKDEVSPRVLALLEQWVKERL